MLEQKCRDRGLIPQGAKCGIKEICSAAEAMGALPSIPPMEGRGDNEAEMPILTAHRILLGAISRRPQKITDKARFRYVMYRAPADPKLLSVVLRLLPRHPEHIDAFTAYFSNYGRHRGIATAALKYLASGVPYSYVRGELWHLIARLAFPDELRRGLDMARKDALGRSRCVVLSWGVMHFLMRCKLYGLIRDSRRLNKEHPISRSLLAPQFNAKEFTPGGHIVTLLKGNLMEQLAGARAMQRQNVSLAELGLRQSDLQASCIASLKALGVIQRQLHRGSRDYIGEILSSLYKCVKVPLWRELLGAEYEHALQVLIEAKDRYPGSYSDWLALQDSFSDLVTRQFMAFMKANGIPGHMPTFRGTKLEKYGKFLMSGSNFSRNHPVIANNLYDIHNRRNRLPGSHPYDEKGGARNKFLKKHERDALASKVKLAFDEIATVVAAHI